MDDINPASGWKYSVMLLYSVMIDGFDENLMIEKRWTKRIDDGIKMHITLTHLQYLSLFS